MSFGGQEANDTTSNLFNLGLDNLKLKYKKIYVDDTQPSQDEDDITTYDKFKQFIGYRGNEETYKENYHKVNEFDLRRIETMKNSLNSVFQDINHKDLSIIALDDKYIYESKPDMRRRSQRGVESNYYVLKNINKIRYFTSEVWSLWNGLYNKLFQMNKFISFFDRMFSKDSDRGLVREDDKIVSNYFNLIDYNFDSVDENIDKIFSTQEEREEYFVENSEPLRDSREKAAGPSIT